MSRVIENRTEIKDKELAFEALRQAGINYNVDGETIFLTSGPLKNSYIDLKTGHVRGDSDYGHTKEMFGLLHQHYTVAKIRQEYLRAGATIESVTTDEEGTVILAYQFAAVG
jgi:hypothetical protein